MCEMLVLYDRETSLSNSKCMSVNSFVCDMKLVHCDSRDSVREKQDDGSFTPVESNLAADWSKQTHHQTLNNQAL